MTVTLSREEARALLVSHSGLASWIRQRGKAASRRVLDALRCIQLDPLEPLGSNADLVLMARVHGAKRGDVYEHLMPGHAFEHFAKERCLVHASAFPQYRRRAAETPWWRLAERLKRIDERMQREVLEEVRARGPITASDLEHRGDVEPLDWSGWKGTKSATTMALQILWTRCEVVVCGRTPSGNKIYDVPDRALPHVDGVVPPEPFERWAIVERARAAGLLSTASGPHWSMLSEARTSGVVEELLADRSLERVIVEGSSRTYLAAPDVLRSKVRSPDADMRLLGPLDPLLWDRKLVGQAFGFDYVWEVYKPAKERLYAWYVCPLLHEGRLVGRLSGKLEEQVLVVNGLWEQSKGALDLEALDACLERHANACGASSVKRPRRARPNPQ